MNQGTLKRFLEANPFWEIYDWHPMTLALSNRKKDNPKYKIPKTPTKRNKKPSKKRNLLHGVR
jgi:hypothetical protein